MLDDLRAWLNKDRGLERFEHRHDDAYVQLKVDEPHADPVDRTRVIEIHRCPWPDCDFSVTVTRPGVGQ